MPCRSGILLEPLIRAPSRPTGAAKLPTTAPGLFCDDMLDTELHEVMLLGRARKRLCLDITCSCPQDRQLRLGHALALAVHPRQRIIAFGSTHVDQHPFWRGDGTLVSAGREDDVGQLFDDPLQSRIGAGRVLPDLIGLGGKIYLGIGLSIENACLLVVEIDKGAVTGVILEESFVGAHTSALALRRARTRSRRRSRRSTPSAGRNE